MPDMPKVDEFIDQMNSDISKLLAEEGIEETYEARIEVMNDFLDDFNKDFVDTFINRSIRMMFEFFVENLTRESQGLEPIPFQ